MDLDELGQKLEKVYLDLAHKDGYQRQTQLALARAAQDLGYFTLDLARRAYHEGKTEQETNLRDVADSWYTLAEAHKELAREYSYKKAA